MENQKNEQTLKTDEATKKRKSILYTDSAEEILRDGIRRDIGIAKFLVDNVVSGIEETVVKKEEQRDYKMKVDFEREKDFYLNQQTEYKQKIEMISMHNLNERLINFLKEEKNNQQDLYNKYFTLNLEIVGKIKKIKETLPEYVEKLKNKKEKLKSKNLKLMEIVNKLEKEREDSSQVLKMSQLELDENKNPENTLENSKILNINNYKTISIRNMTHNQSINISDLIEDNDYLKERFERLKILKEKLKITKKENKYLANEIANINSTYFYLTKIFTEGMHELSKELLKIHEIQLDKILLKNSNSNSLYFELIKERQIGNLNGSYNNSDNSMKLPIISNNIQKKYNYPLIEKSTPTNSIYNVIKNMIDEHHTLNKNLSVKKKKIEWEEFKNFSAYQIYTLLSLNREIIKKIETKIYPRKFNHVNMNLNSVNNNSHYVEEVSMNENE